MINRQAHQQHASLPVGSGEPATGSVFRYLFQTLLRGKWILIGVLTVVLGLVFFYLAYTPPVYLAKSTLIIDNSKEGQTGFDFTGLAANREVIVEVEVLRSLDVAKRVGRRLEGMLQGREYTRYDDLATFPLFQTEEGTLQDDPLVLARLLQKMIEVDQVRREVGVVKLEVKSTRAEEAELIANLYAEEYAKRNVEISRVEAAGLRQFVQDQLGARQESLSEAEQALQAYREQEDAIALDREAEQLTIQIADLQSSRDQALVELEMVEAELTSLESEVRQIEPNLAARVSSGLEHEISALQTNIAEREVRVEAKYARNPNLRGNEAQDPELVRDLEEIDRLKQQVAERSQRYVGEVLSTGGIDTDVAGRGDGAGLQGALAIVSRLRRQITEKNIQASGLRARVNVLNGRMARYEREFARIPAQSRQLASLERQQLSLESTYQWLQERYEEARMAEESEFGYVQILDVAEVPNEPVEPRPFYSLVLGGLLGVILAVVLVFGREIMDERIRRPDDIKQLGLPLAGVIPRFDRTLKQIRKGASYRGSGLSEYLMVHHEPEASASEAYHRVLAGLEFVGDAISPQVVLVTSPKAGEGKSVTAANLAVAMAQSGRRTLLLDANPRRAQVHHFFHDTFSPGMTNLLVGQAYMRASIRASTVHGLHYLPAGDAEASALVASRELTALITYLRRTYERIIIDAGALLTAGGAVALTALSDAVLLVIRTGKTAGVDLEEALDALGQIRAPRTAAILNDFDAKSAFGYYSDRGYYGRYGSARESKKPSPGSRLLGQGRQPIAPRMKQLPANTPQPRPAPDRRPRQETPPPSTPRPTPTPRSAPVQAPPPAPTRQWTPPAPASPRPPQAPSVSSQPSVNPRPHNPWPAPAPQRPSQSPSQPQPSPNAWAPPQRAVPVTDPTWNQPQPPAPSDANTEAVQARIVPPYEGDGTTPLAQPPYTPDPNQDIRRTDPWGDGTFFSER